MMRVLIVQELLAHYRVVFYNRLRDRLASDGVELLLVHGQATGSRALRGDEASLPWAMRVANLRLPLGGDRYALWQPVLRLVRTSDLTIVEQANKHIVNFVLICLPRRHRLIAFWGHGADLQSGHRRPVSSRLKRWCSVKPDWWFAYTEGSARRISSFGFPSDKITVVQNAVDLVPAGDVQRIKNKCVFIGALTPEKSLRYLLDASDVMATTVPGFELVVAGDGPMQQHVNEWASVRPWVSVMSATFGEEKTKLLKSAQLVLMPGLVGLVAVDSLSAGTPLVTVDSPIHSPEFEYLTGENSVILPSRTVPAKFGEAVARLLLDEEQLQSLRDGCARSSQIVNIENMVANYRLGVLKALDCAQVGRK